ncbi:S1C family serine protease [Desulfothermobacter acidiphilus]|uniref:S1C family serine protease n=1 Tax=Desulfothermobacter acidiphilus TaxID=1938353 RepID=UPI003F8A2D2B
MPWRRWIAPIALLAFLAGIFFTAGCYYGSSSKAPALADNQVAPGVGPNAIANIVEQASPAVVKIDTVAPKFDPFFNNPFFRQFFGDMPRVQEYQEGLGSGFFITDDGYILTNEHVIDGASQITVTVTGFSQPFKARVVGSDYDLDLAVLKIDLPKKVPYLKLGDSNKMRVGDWVIAIGNPYGLDHTVTVGVLSAKGRPIDIGNRHYKNLLQTDAAINPGNSGGPLLNLNGEVIGINTAVNAQAQGIGFAIPSDTVKSVLNELMTKGKIVRPWLGVQVGPVDQNVAQYLGLPKAEGALVLGVVPGSPAEKAGITRGDVILEINGQKVATPDDLVAAVKNLKVGAQADVSLWRGGKIVRVQLKVTEKPAGM